MVLHTSGKTNLVEPYCDQLKLIEKMSFPALKDKYTKEKYHDKPH